MRYVIVALLLAFIVAGCGGQDVSDRFPDRESSGLVWTPPETPLPPAAPVSTSPPVVASEFVAGVEHPYFPMTPGRVLTYEGVDNGRTRVDEVRAVADARIINRVSCTAVFQDVYLDGLLAELTTEWYAQDEHGNLWKFGEESLEFNGIEFLKSADSWVAGEEGAQAWMVLAAEPRVGDVYLGLLPTFQDVMEVLSLNETATVPAGVFLNCIEMIENPNDPDDQDIILYAPSVGLVSETHIRGKIELVSIADE